MNTLCREICGTCVGPIGGYVIGSSKKCRYHLVTGLHHS